MSAAKRLWSVLTQRLATFRTTNSSPVLRPCMHKQKKHKRTTHERERVHITHGLRDENRFNKTHTICMPHARPAAICCVSLVRDRCVWCVVRLELQRRVNMHTCRRTDPTPGLRERRVREKKKCDGVLALNFITDNSVFSFIL